jgi:hypothetical protein
MTTANVFQRISEALDRAGIPYMLAGSFAGSLYGKLRSSAASEAGISILSSPPLPARFAPSCSLCPPINTIRISKAALHPRIAA